MVSKGTYQFRLGASSSGRNHIQTCNKQKALDATSKLGKISKFGNSQIFHVRQALVAFVNPHGLLSYGEYSL